MESERMLQELVRYNSWANQQVLEACEGVPEEMLEGQILGAFGTMYETLVHVVRSEAGYVRMLTGTRPEPVFDWDERPSLAEVKVFAAEVGEKLAEAAQTVPLTKQITEEYEGEPLYYNALLVFIQVINHGIEHRTNITTVLNIEGLSPPDVAGWGYLLAHRGRFEG